MIRDINADYLEPLQGVFPANRLGPLGDVPKVDLLDLPPRRLQAALRRQHAEGLPGACQGWGSDRRPGATRLAHGARAGAGANAGIGAAACIGAAGAVTNGWGA